MIRSSLLLNEANFTIRREKRHTQRMGMEEAQSLVPKGTSLPVSHARSCSRVLSNVPSSDTYPYLPTSLKTHCHHCIRGAGGERKERGKRRVSAVPSLGPLPVKVMVLQGSLAWAPQHHYDPALQRPHLRWPRSEFLPPDFPYSLNRLTLRLQRRPHPTLPRILPTDLRTPTPEARLRY